MPTREKFFFELLAVADLMRDITAHMHESRIGNFTVSQMRLVKHVLSHEPDGVMLKDLARDQGVTPSAVSQTLDNLVKVGVLERRQQPHDRRALAIHATEAALKKRDEIEAVLNAVAEEALGHLSRIQRAEFERSVCALAEALRAKRKVVIAQCEAQKSAQNAAAAASETPSDAQSDAPAADTPQA